MKSSIPTFLKSRTTSFSQGRANPFRRVWLVPCHSEAKLQRRREQIICWPGLGEVCTSAPLILSILLSPPSPTHSQHSHSSHGCFQGWQSLVFFSPIVETGNYVCKGSLQALTFLLWALPRFKRAHYLDNYQSCSFMEVSRGRSEAGRLPRETVSQWNPQSHPSILWLQSRSLGSGQVHTYDQTSHFICHCYRLLSVKMLTFIM